MKKHAKQGLCFRSAMLSVAFLLMSLISFSASAYDFEIDGIGYDIKSAEEHTVSVVSLKNVPKGADCVIPESVTWQDTQYSVVEISMPNTRGGDNSNCKTISIPASVINIYIRTHLPDLTDFIVNEHNPAYCSVDGVLFNKELTKVLLYPNDKPETSYSIPSTVTAVGDNAFNYSYNLQEIILPPSVESIGYNSFFYCSSLISIDFPDSVTFIDSGAMGLCTNLQTVTIGKSLSEIGDKNPFERCSSLKEINVDVENKNFCSNDGVLYRKVEDSGLELICFPLGKNAKLYSFPDNIVAIGAYSFYFCNTLSDLALPNSIKRIGQCAFSYSSLESIKLPTSVSEIDEQSFTFIWELSKIDVDKENPVFSSIDGVLYKNGTTLFCFPAGHPAIEFDIPEGVLEIGKCAFQSCKKVEKISIPESVTDIEFMAFYDCNSLKSIIIPNSVEIINQSILSSCNDLQTVTIGSSVQVIEDGAFNGDNNINTITCLPTVPPEVSESGLFENEVYQAATLYVPYGCKEAYSTAEMWSNFQNIVEMEPVGISDINTTDGEVSIGVENGAIVVTGTDSSDVVEVYTADGRCVYRGNDTEIAGLAPGLYIVRTGSAVSKVIL